MLTNKAVVVKILKPVKRSKIRREVKILETLKDAPNTVRLHEVLTDASNGTPSLVFDYVPNVEFRDMYPLLVEKDIKTFIF